MFYYQEISYSIALSWPSPEPMRFTKDPTSELLKEGESLRISAEEKGNGGFCIREESSSNIGKAICYPGRKFYRFKQSVQVTIYIYIYIYISF
jgi:hypothetical protein